MAENTKLSIRRGRRDRWKRRNHEPWHVNIVIYIWKSSQLLKMPRGIGATCGMGIRYDTSSNDQSTTAKNFVQLVKIKRVHIMINNSEQRMATPSISLLRLAGGPAPEWITFGCSAQEQERRILCYSISEMWPVRSECSLVSCRAVMLKWTFILCCKLFTWMQRFNNRKPSIFCVLYILYTELFCPTLMPQKLKYAWNNLRIYWPPKPDLLRTVQKENKQLIV